MGIAKEIESRLNASFAPSALQVYDESERHRGHAGYQEGGESHWRIVIAADSFAGMTRIARHRAIHAALGQDIISRIHALAIEIV